MSLVTFLGVIGIFATGSNRFEYWHFDDGNSWVIESPRIDIDYNPFSMAFEWAYYNPSGNAPFSKRNRPYKYVLTYQRDWLNLSIGTITPEIGRGFLAYFGEDDVSLLDRFVKGAMATFYLKKTQIDLWGGFPESYIFYQLVNDSTDRVFGGSIRSSISKVSFGLEGGVIQIKDLISKEYKHSSMAGIWLETTLSGTYLYLETAYRKGFDRKVFKDTSGYALYFNAVKNIGRFSFSLETKSMSAFGHEYMLPPAIDHYGIYLNNGRKEHALGTDISYTTRDWLFNGHVSKNWDIFREPSAFISEYFVKIRRRLPYADITLQYDDISIKNAPAAGIFDRREQTPVFGIVSRLSRKIGMEFKLINRIRSNNDYSYTDRDITAGLSIFPYLDFAFTFQKRGGDSTGTWQRLDVFLHPSPWSEIELTIGSQRKDLVCSGGVCRYEPEFKGTRIKVLLRF